MPQAPLMCSMNQLSNHDHSRFLTRTGLKVGRVSDLGTTAAAEGVRESVYREAAVLQMTWPGAPTLYYGDEAGVCGFTDPDNRRTYPWGRENKEMIRFHRELIKMHKELKCLKDGAVIRLADARNMLSYGRFDGSSSVVVILNNSDDTMRVRIPVVYAGVPENAQMRIRFMTTQSGFVSYPKKKKTVPVTGGMLEMELAPESSAVLVW
jgi:alpha-glucosidase